MKNKYPALKLFVLSFIAVALFMTGSVIADQAPESSLKEVEGKKVCMITNQLFIKDQIPVELEGKTYYGCCEMCEAKLKNTPESRVGIDPVSGNKVDKSEAVIGAAPDGSVYYFESQENLVKFSPSIGN